MMGCGFDHISTRRNQREHQGAEHFRKKTPPLFSSLVGFGLEILGLFSVAHGIRPPLPFLLIWDSRGHPWNLIVAGLQSEIPQRSAAYFPAQAAII